VSGDFVDLSGNILNYDSTGFKIDKIITQWYDNGVNRPIMTNYCMETYLKNSFDYDLSPISYTTLSIPSSAYVSLASVSSELLIDKNEVGVYYGPDDLSNYSYNTIPFKLKNMYNFDWNTDLLSADTFIPGSGVSGSLTGFVPDSTIQDTSLAGVRRYNKIGKDESTFWLSYNYNKSLEENFSDVYENVELVKGLIKLQPPKDHKSNIFSISVKNSGLNNQITDPIVKHDIQQVIKSSILEVIEKLSPCSTQLWKIVFDGI